MKEERNQANGIAIPNDFDENGAIDINQVNAFRTINILDFLHELKPPEWLVKGLIEKDTLTNIYGPSESGKTFIAVDLAMSICTGQAFFKRKVKQGWVLYILAEGNNGFMRRVTAWKIRKQHKGKSAPLHTSLMAARITDAEFMKSVKAEIDRLTELEGQPPSAIFVDTLARNFGPGDENQSKDMGPFIANLDHYLRADYKSAVIVIHHTGKDTDRGPRGSSALHAAVDHQFRIKKLGEGRIYDSGPHQGLIICEKNKEGKKTKPMGFRLDEVEVGIQDEEGKELTSACVMPDEIDIRLLGLSMNGEPTNKNKGQRQRQVANELSEMFAQRRQTLESQGNDPNDARIHFDDLIASLNDKYKNKSGKPAFKYRSAKARVRECIKEAGYILTDNYIDQIDTIF